MKWKINRQVSIGYKPDGTRLVKWIHANSEREFEAKKKELLMDWEEAAASDITFGKFVEKWYKAYKSNVSPYTDRNYKSLLHQISSLNNKKLKNIYRTDLQMVLADLPPYTAQQAKQIMKAIFRAAYADGLIPNNPAEYLVTQKCVKTEKKPFTDAENKAIKAADLEPMARLYVDILYYLGLRPEEARALCWGDFDLVNGTVTISKALIYPKGQPLIKGTKTGKVRTIPIPDVLIAEIKAYKRSKSALYLFVNKVNGLMTECQERQMQKAINTAINAAMGGNDKLKVWNRTLYDFRHNRASQLYYLAIKSNGKLSFFQCAEYMGHTQKMFLETYAHPMEEKKAVDLLKKIVNS